MSVVKRAKPASPRSYLFLGVRMVVHIPGERTDNQLSLIEGFMPPGGDNGLHVHQYEDESMYLISGELEVTIGNLQFTMRPGESYFAPRNMPHRLRNTGTTEARTLLIDTPGTFTSFIRQAGTLLTGSEIPQLPPPTAQEMLDLQLLSEQFGSHILIPPFQDGTAEYKRKPPIYKRPVYKREQETYFFFGVPTVIHLAGMETGNEFSLLESFMSADGDSGLHVHANEDECIYLLSGELEMTMGDSLFTLRSGASCFVPRNVPHRLRNKKTRTARVMHVNTPATLDPFIRLAGIRIKSPGEVVSPYPSPDQIGPILLLSEEYDFHMLIPPGI
jgi:mannose-6-phosphate isomerase-like protein (cupin superfamily)